jgi:tetratricopeptide (TPR) repeat protein
MRFFVFLLGIVLVWSCADSSRSAYDIPQEKVEEERLDVILEQLSESIKSNPSNPLPYYKRAYWQFTAGKYDEALIDISRAERLSPNSGEILFLKSAILYKSGKESALENALFAEDQEYESPDLYTLIGNLYLDKKEFNKAQAYFTKAENLYPYHADVFSSKGRYSAMQGDTGQAVRHYKRALGLRSDVFDHYNDLIRIYLGARQVDSALYFNEMAIRKFPESPELQYNKGLILENAGWLDSAVVVYRNFLRNQPERTEVYERIGNLYYRKKNYSAAFVNYNRWAEADPENPVAYLKAARSYIAQLNLPAAKYYLTKALEKLPENSVLKAELNAVNYRIASGNYRYANPVEEEKEEEVERTLNLDLKQLQKKKTTLISRDSTRNKR